VKNPEEMNFAELQEAGLLSYAAVRNWRMWKEFKDLRAQGLKVFEAHEKLAEKYFLSPGSVIHGIRNAMVSRKRLK